MEIHLVVIQTPGYIHSLGFLDSARFLRHQFRRLGYDATIGKNRPRRGAVNILFGAHLGIPESWEHEFICVIFNQEQLGAGGAAVPPAYIQLLRRTHVLDYDSANIPAYADGVEQPDHRFVGIAPLLYAPYLDTSPVRLGLEDRPIDLLFIGSMNQARQRVISRIESCGLEVSSFDHPMYGPERDHYIAQSKAVLNIPFYESTRFEQTRVFNALSIGTPVVSLRRPGLIVDPAFESAVHWFEDSDLERYFSLQFNSEGWFKLSGEQLGRWRENDGLSVYRALARNLNQLVLPSASLFDRDVTVGEECSESKSEVKVIRRLNLSPERGYRPEWVNASIVDANISRDIALDLNSLNSPTEQILISESGVHYVLRQGEINEVYLYCRHGCLPSPLQMSWIRNLLSPQGSLVLELSILALLDIDQRPNVAFTLSAGQVRLLQEEVARIDFNQTILALHSCELTKEAGICSDKVWLGRFVFCRRYRTPRETVVARMIRDDFFGLPEDVMKSQPIPNVNGVTGETKTSTKMAV
jgi:hypothetical protein